MKVTVKGKSVSGVGTSLVVPELGLALDLGYCSGEARECQTVLLTHGHPDHVAGVVMHASTRAMTKLSPSRFVCSPEVASFLREMLGVWAKHQELAYTVVELSPGETLNLGKGLSVRPFPTYHRGPSQGYAVVKTTLKLKVEFEGLSGPEVGALRQQGVEVTNRVEQVVLTYTGDTTPEALDHEDVQQAETVVTECTFFGPLVSVEKARAYGHTHLDELVPQLAKLKNRVFLTHVSMRHCQKQARQEVTRLTKEMQCKVHLLLDREGLV